jgi:hypothetical protein
MAVVGALVGTAAAAPSALGDTFNVYLHITKGKFDSSYSCLPGCEQYGGYHSLNETDGVTSAGGSALALVADYDGLSVPRQGAAAKPGHPIVIKSDVFSVLGGFQLFGTYWTSDNPDTPLNCTGRLGSNQNPPEILSAPGNSKTELKLYVEAARTNSDGATLVPSGVTGQGNCSELNHHWHAGFPVSWQDNGSYVQDMLTADVSVPLKSLRDLKVHGKHTMTFNEQKAKYQPPADCSAWTNGKCTESVHWTGELVFTRTS